MSKELMAMSNGTFTLAESENPNVFYFYRNDNEVIGDVGRIPMGFYQNYICKKMMDGEIKEMVMNDICFETSNDGKCIRLTISGIGECKAKEKKSNFIKRFFNRMFKWFFRLLEYGAFTK